MEEKDYPTAIVPVRPASLADRFDTLARRLGDPLTRLFIIANTSPDEDNQLRAAAELLPYRYPRLRAAETTINANGAGQVNIQINIGAPDPLS